MLNEEQLQNIKNTLDKHEEESLLSKGFSAPGVEPTEDSKPLQFVDAPNKVGRPTVYTPELANLICELIGNGSSMRNVCLKEDMPAMQTIWRWLREKKDFSEQYARACEERTEAQNENLLDLGDEAIDHAYKADPKASSAVVQAVKLKADNLKWVMSKMKPKKYGDKLDMTTNGKDLPIPLLNVLHSNNSSKENSEPKETN